MNKQMRETVWEKIKRVLLADTMKISRTAELHVEEHEGLKGEDIVTLSTQDWNDLWTRKQRFVLQFARQGNRVLYVETQFHWVSYVRQFRKHWRRVFLFALGARRVEENLFVYTPPLLVPAFQVFPSLAKVNNFVLGIALKRVMKKLGMKSPVLWIYTHFNKSLIKKLGAKKALYECVDDYSGAKGLIKREVVIKQEAETLKEVNAAIVTAESLRPSKLAYNSRIHVVCNAANVSHFNRAVSEKHIEPVDLSGVGRPRLVFLGMTQYWVDLELLDYIAGEKPEWQIVMIGPVAVDVRRFERAKNMHFLGNKPYDDLPDYMAYCDVALNPYRVDDVAKGCSPLKLYEYLAAGLPVVSTEMPEARKFDKIVTVASNYEMFVLAVEEILIRDAGSREELKKQALAESQKHSWEKRFREVEKIAMEVLR